MAAKDAHATKVDGKTNAAEHDDLVSVCDELSTIAAPEARELFDSVEHDCGADGSEEARVAEGADNFCSLPAKRHCLRALAERQLGDVVAAQEGGNIREHVEGVRQHSKRAGQDAHNHLSNKVAA